MNWDKIAGIFMIGVVIGALFISVLADNFWKTTSVENGAAEYVLDGKTGEVTWRRK